MTHRFSNQISGCLLAAVTVLGLIPSASFAGIPAARSFAQNSANPNPSVLPPVSAAHGHTYAEWSELWWLWFIPQTSTNNAINDCPAGQSGQVWFLEASGSTCAVPAGKALFFPIVDAE